MNKFAEHIKKHMGKRAKINKKAEYGEYAGNSFLEHIANSLEEGYSSGADPVWDIEIRVDNCDFDDLSMSAKDYLRREVSYPIRDGHLSYMDVEVVLNGYAAQEYFDEDDLMAIFGDKKIVKKLLPDENAEKSFYVSYDLDVDEEELERNSSKRAKVTKKADIDQRLSYGHFIKQEDENKLPKFNTLEDIKKYIKNTNRFPNNFFYKGGLFTEDEYDLEGMYVTYGSPEIDKAIVINTPDNRYNHKGNYKNLDIEIKEEDSPDFRTDINYTLPIKVYEKYFPKKQSSKTNKLANIIRREINKSAGSIDYEVMMDIPQNSNVKKEDIIDEIQHLGDTYNLGLDDMYDFQPNHTITFTLPMEKANKLISELENLGFRLLRREKKDNRTQYEWERDQKIYD